jgi:hypothetical protein
MWPTGHLCKLSHGNGHQYQVRKLKYTKRVIRTDNNTMTQRKNPGPGLRHLYIFLGPMDTFRLIRIQIQVIVTIHSDWDADVLLENSTTQTWHICLSIESPPISEWYRGCIYTVYQCDILLTNQMNRSVTCFLTKEIV